MELLYVHIKDDKKNIKDCGFNFSPKYRFCYDLIGNTLHKEILSDYVPNFWDAENILNITAIIGKNGSGKSNLLEYIMLAICGKSAKPLLVWEYKGQTYSNKEVKSNCEIKIGSYVPFKAMNGKGIDDTLLMYYSSNIDRNIRIDNTQFADISTANLIRMKRRDQERSYAFRDIDYLQIQDTFKQIKFINDFNDKFLPDDIIFPEYLEITISVKEKTLDIKHPTYKKLAVYGKLTFEKGLRVILLQQIFSDNNNVSKSWNEDTELNEVLSTGKADSFYTELINLYNLGDIRCDLRELSGISTSSEFKFFIKRTSLSNKVISAINKYYFNNSYNSITSDPTCTTIGAGIYDNNNCIIKWEGLSSGELAFYNILSRIFNKLIEYRECCYNDEIFISDPLKYKNIILILDEPELSFHPEWQKRFLQILIDALKSEIFECYDFQIIIASHSPILVSDFPKNNIIFLDKTGKGYCNVVDPAGLNNTLGASIYSLYQNNFFIDGLPIGDFAKKKIITIQNKIEQGNVSKDIYNQIQLIGEPIIKFQLNELYRANPNIEEQIKALKEDIRRLELKQQGHDKNK